MNEASLTTAAAALMATAREGRGVPLTAPDFGFDPHFIERIEPLLDLLWSRYFRVRLLGMENLPASGPALVVANHSGGVPYDGAMLIYAFHRLYAGGRALRPLVANFAFRSNWIAPVLARVGGVRASMENALGLLARGDLVGVFPEGLRGVGKLFRERYRLTGFGRGGFVRLARRARVPIVPVAIVGAEEIHPVLGKLTTIAQPLGLPYIPITPTFPWLGPLGLLPLPTKWTIQMGAPLVMQDSDDEAAVLEDAERVRAAIDGMIATLLLQRRSIFFG